MRGLALVLLVAGCTGEPASAALVDPSETFRFSALESVEPIVDGPRTKWEMRDEVTVALQRIPIADRSVRERTLGGVASALSQRFALGEVSGELHQTECVVAGVEARCVSGWTTHDSRRFVRRGLLFRAGTEIVLLEAIGPESARDDVDRQSELIRRTLVLLEGGRA